jgi:hypothetical protein
MRKCKTRHQYSSIPPQSRLRRHLLAQVIGGLCFERKSSWPPKAAGLPLEKWS